VFSLEGTKLVSAERLALVARRLNIRQAEPIPQQREMRAELAEDVVLNIRELVLYGTGNVMVKAADEEISGHPEGAGSAYFNAFSSYFPSVNIRLKEKTVKSSEKESPSSQRSVRN